MKKQFAFWQTAFSVLRIGSEDSKLKRREREVRGSSGASNSERVKPTVRGGAGRQIYGVNLRKSFSRKQNESLKLLKTQSFSDFDFSVI